MKVVITGGSGFIGTNLTLWFAKNEPDTEVVVLDIVPPQVALPANASFVYGDTRDLKTLIETFKGVSEVYNLAGMLGTSELIPLCKLAVDVNIGGVVNVLDACAIAGVERVYNVAKPHFDSLHENVYTLTKDCAENIGKLYREKHGLSVATVRWMNAVGPYQHLFPVRKLLPTLITFALNGVPMEVYGDGTQVIDPMDADDLCDYTVYACRNLGHSDVIYDLGAGYAIDCNEVVSAIQGKVHDLFGIKATIKHVPMRAGEKPGGNLVADTSYWDSIGMHPRTTFDQTLDKCVRYYNELDPVTVHNALKFYGKV